MTYVEHYPGNQLNAFIEKIWYCAAPGLDSSVLTIPLTRHELVFNFSENYWLKDPGDKGYIMKDPRTWVSGLQSKAIFSSASGHHEMLGILFRPNGLKAFTKYYSSDFSGQFIDASLVWGRPVEIIAEQMQDAGSVQEKITLAEKFLITNNNDHDQPAYMARSLEQLSAGIGPRGNIKDMCRQLSVSNKSLIQSFKKYIGVNPAGYAHLQAVNQALNLLSKGPKQSLTKMAHTLNFYDQSHFIRLFRSITSMTPSEYSACVIDNRVDKNSPNFISLQG